MDLFKQFSTWFSDRIIGCVVPPSDVRTFVRKQMKDIKDLEMSLAKDFVKDDPNIVEDVRYQKLEGKRDVILAFGRLYPEWLSKLE